MPLPETREGILAAGYAHMRDGRCRAASCDAPVEWWVTPRGKYQPFDLVERAPLEGGAKRDRLLPHHASCPEVSKFRTKGAA